MFPKSRSGSCGALSYNYFRRRIRLSDKANKITTEGYVPQILNHQRHYAIGNFKWFVYSIKEQENKKTYQPHRGDGATKLRMILKD